MGPGVRVGDKAAGGAMQIGEGGGGGGRREGRGQNDRPASG